MNFSFESFTDGSYDFDPVTEQHTGLHLMGAHADIGGGKITCAEIDVLADHPDLDTVSVSGLNQATFAYFIRTYGRQFRAIRFFKNKAVEDWSLLGTLPQLEYVHYFFNQRITRLWDMSGNTALTHLAIENFSRLHSLAGIETAPTLRVLEVGDAVWPSMTLDTLAPLAKTAIEEFSFTGKAILDGDYSVVAAMPSLRVFNCPLNMVTTEQAAWLAANCPHLSGYALAPMVEYPIPEYHETSGEYVRTPHVMIVGKRKPTLPVAGNEERIRKYAEAFEALKERYRGVPYAEAFPKKA